MCSYTHAFSNLYNCHPALHTDLDLIPELKPMLSMSIEGFSGQETSLQLKLLFCTDSLYPNRTATVSGNNVFLPIEEFYLSVRICLMDQECRNLFFPELKMPMYCLKLLGVH